jgi:hypothetical protein
MLSTYLVRMIEGHADELTRELLDDLARNPRTPSFHAMPREEMHRRVHDLYLHLGSWLGEQSEDAIERVYTELGQHRFAEGLSLAESLCAMLLAKEHMRSFIRRAGAPDSALELHREVEMNVQLGHFFDRAIYHAVRGYEAARAAAAGRGSPATP